MIRMQTYDCQCGYTARGENLTFCAKCARPFNRVDGKPIFRYINKCDCCEDNVERSCAVCGSVPTPMTKEEFDEYVVEQKNRYKEISAHEFSLRKKDKALFRVNARARGIDCSCTAYGMCSYHADAYE